MFHPVLDAHFHSLLFSLSISETSELLRFLLFHCSHNSGWYHLLLFTAGRNQNMDEGIAVSFTEFAYALNPDLHTI